MAHRKRVAPVLLGSLTVLALGTAACVMELGHLAGRATDEWTHTYPLKSGGELRINNTNGLIEIEGVEGPTLEVRAERIARGVSDEAARELLPRIVITHNRKTMEIADRLYGVTMEEPGVSKLISVQLN